tara:strand:+ start:520 stop:909 length:390 start_codon:yes stop_codon:yes gene_type:complete
LGLHFDSSQNHRLRFTCVERFLQGQVETGQSWIGRNKGPTRHEHQSQGLFEFRQTGNLVTTDAWQSEVKDRHSIAPRAQTFESKIATIDEVRVVTQLSYAVLKDHGDDPLIFSDQNPTTGVLIDVTVRL